MKSVENETGEITITSYIRNASGNVMAIYETKEENEEIAAKPKEFPIYGSGRLGQYRPTETTNDEGEVVASKKTALGQRIYEFANHLGNVLVTLTDNKTLSDDGSTYKATILSSSDYYPFGLAMSQRTTNNSAYRYGFNGQEQSDELDQNGNSYTAEYWQYDARTGRRWNLDPVVVPFESRYATFRNNPIAISDANGDVGQIAAGAIIGGLMGLGGEIMRQVALGEMKWDNIGTSVLNIAVATGKGAAIGAVAATGCIPCAAATGAYLGGMTDFVSQVAIQGKSLSDVDINTIGINALAGGISGGLGAIGGGAWTGAAWKGLTSLSFNDIALGASLEIATVFANVAYTKETSKIQIPTSTDVEQEQPTTVSNNEYNYYIEIGNFEGDGSLEKARTLAETAGTEERVNNLRVTWHGDLVDGVQIFREQNEKGLYTYRVAIGTDDLSKAKNLYSEFLRHGNRVFVGWRKNKKAVMVSTPIIENNKFLRPKGTAIE